MSKNFFSWKILGMIVIPVAIIMLIFENNQNLEFEMETNVYKILTQEQWLISKKNGFVTTELDTKDGFVHLSTAKQLSGTLYYFFSQNEALVLLQFNSSDLGDKLIFEEPYPKLEHVQGLLLTPREAARRLRGRRARIRPQHGRRCPRTVSH